MGAKVTLEVWQQGTRLRLHENRQTSKRDHSVKGQGLRLRHDNYARELRKEVVAKGVGVT